MSDLVSALGLVLAIEGALYALAPGSMRAMVARLLQTPDDAIRTGGLVAAVVGVVLVWVARSG
ncbi:DUF2065 domain-containing protein [Acuticoccus sp.]|uniref:DUF2065 domain-containing protein n=1 Tax=Acuticoccus sp. TaxID=1904378 RepID=UPI003B518893